MTDGGMDEPTAEPAEPQASPPARPAGITLPPLTVTVAAAASAAGGTGPRHRGRHPHRRPPARRALRPHRRGPAGLGRGGHRASDPVRSAGRRRPQRRRRAGLGAVPVARLAAHRFPGRGRGGRRPGPHRRPARRDLAAVGALLAVVNPGRRRRPRRPRPPGRGRRVRSWPCRPWPSSTPTAPATPTTTARTPPRTDTTTAPTPTGRRPASNGARSDASAARPRRGAAGATITATTRVRPRTGSGPIISLDDARVTADQRSAAQGLIDTTTTAMAQYTDPASVEAAGYNSIGDSVHRVRALRQLRLPRRRRRARPGARRVDRVRRSTTDGTKEMVSAMYILNVGKTMADVPDIAGELTTWHDHQNLCWDGTGGSSGFSVNGACTRGHVPGDAADAARVDGAERVRAVRRDRGSRRRLRPRSRRGR